MEAPKHKDNAARSFPLRWLVRLANVVWFAVLAILVLVALYVVIGRQLMGSVSDYRQELESRLSDRLGQPVHIDRLYGHWKALDPVLTVSGLTIQDPDSPDTTVAHLDRINIRLDSLTSLIRGRLVFGNLVADGLNLTLDQTESGAITVEGIPPAQSSFLDEPESGGSPAASGPRKWINRLGDILSDPSVQLNQVRLGLKVPGEERRTFFIPQVDLRYVQGVFSASGRAMQPGSATQLARFYLEGQHFFRGDFDGRVFVDIDSGRLFDAFAQRYEWEKLAIAGFDAGGQAWLHFTHGDLETVNARVSVPHLQLRADGETQAPVEAIRAHVGWRRQSDQDWQLDIKDLSWRWSGDAVAPIDLKIDRSQGWDIRANRLPVGILSRMALAIAPLQKGLRTELAGYQPAGELREIVFRAQTLSDFRLTAELADVSVEAFDGAPGARGLDGTLAMDATRGDVVVAASDVELGFPELFLRPWLLEQLDARVSWTIDGGHKRVWSDQVEMQYQGQTRLAGAFELDLNEPGDDTLSLRVDSWNATAAMLADFVPAKAVGREFYDWLVAAVQQADVDRGTFYGHGQVNEDSPPGSFTTSMRYHFANARIQYDDAWPAVTDASGVVEVQGEQATIALADGQTGGLSLEPTRIAVDGAATPVLLTIDTAADFAGSDFGQWLTTSPLGSFTGEAAKQLDVQGRYHLDLGLTLPLAEESSPDIDLTLTAKEARVAYADTAAVWENINGTVKYTTQAGFSGDPLVARFFDSPVEISLEEKEKGAPLSVTQTGRLDVNALAGRFGLDPIPGVEGRAAYRATLGLSASGASTLALTSNLSNLTVDWPAPLGKAMGKPAPLNMIVSWGDDDGLLLSGHWEDRLAYRLRWRGDRFDRGRVELGAVTTSLSGEAGLDITGYLNTLDVSAWGDALEAHPVTGGNGQAQPGTTPAWFNRAAVNVGELRVAGQQFAKTAILAMPGKDGWKIALDGPAVQGHLALPASAAPIKVDLDKLVLASDSEEASTEKKAPVSFARRGVASWPQADVTIADLTLGERQYGAWSFLFRPSADALTIDQISGKVGTLAFDGNLIWSGGPQGERTRVNGVLAGENLADIDPWIEGSVPLKNKKSRVEIDLGWPGPPESAGLETLEGTLGFRLDDGVILERNNTAQIFRVFGILNSDTLLRRLKLDFSDLYEAGVAFDAISGTARLSGGTLSWEPELQIVGPSGAFKLTGSTDLVKESLDMRLVVVLPLTQNLPLAAILMGAAAPIGGALFVLDKVLGDPLSRLTSATYSVSGTWDQPEVDLRNVFDTGK